MTLLILLLISVFVVAGIIRYLFYKLTSQSKQTEIIEVYRIKTITGQEIHILDRDMQVYVLDDELFLSCSKNEMCAKMIKNKKVILSYYGFSNTFGSKYRLINIKSM